jgi:hypothetical protein
MDETHIQEAAAVVHTTVGFSACLHGSSYSVSQFLEELSATVAYIKSQNA